MLPFWSVPVCWLGIVGRVLLVMFGANCPVMMGTCRWDPFSGAPMIGPETVVWLLNTEVGGDTTGAGKGDNGPLCVVPWTRVVGGNVAGTSPEPIGFGCNGLPVKIPSCSAGSE